MSAIELGHIPEETQEPLLQRVDPRIRVVACVLFSLLCISLSRISNLELCLFFAAMCGLAARLPLLATLKRMASLDGFMIFVVGFLPFTVPGQTLTTLAGWPVSQEGLLRAGQILLSANAVVLMVLALVGSMDESQLGTALHRLHAPGKFVQLFLFTVRYIDVLKLEYQRLRTSMKVRGFRMGFNIHSWQSLGYLFGMLIVRSLDRSERILIAMRCRGYTGEFRMLGAVRASTLLDVTFAIGMAALCLILIVLDQA